MLKLLNNKVFKVIVTIPLPFYLMSQLELSVPARAASVCDTYNTPFATDSDHDEFSAVESSSREKDLCENIAISNALVDPDLVAGERAGVKFNLGTLGSGQVTALGVSGAFVIDEGVKGQTPRVTGAAAIAFSDNQRGGRASIQFSW